MKKLKMVRGSKERADEIKAWLESQNGKNVHGFNCSCDELLYFIDGFGEINYLHENAVEGLGSSLDYEIVELPKKLPEHQFKPFDKVLVRDREDEKWQCDFFSYVRNNSEDEEVFVRNDNENREVFVCVGNRWFKCIPYEGNEHLLGTAGNPEGGKQ